MKNREGEGRRGNKTDEIEFIEFGVRKQEEKCVLREREKVRQQPGVIKNFFQEEVLSVHRREKNKMVQSHTFTHN